MSTKSPMLGAGFRKIQPKLRMVANGSSQVNEIRSDFSPAVQMAPSFTLTDIAPPNQTMAQVACTARDVKKDPKRGKLRTLVDEVRVSVFIECESETTLDSAAKSIAGVTSKNLTSERGRFATLEVPVSALPQLAEQESVVRIEMGEALKHPRPQVSTATVSAPAKAAGWHWRRDYRVWHWLRQCSSNGGLLSMSQRFC